MSGARPRSCTCPSLIRIAPATRARLITAPEAVSAKWESVVVSALGADAAVAAAAAEAAAAAGLAGGGGKAAKPPSSAPPSAPAAVAAIPLGEFQRLLADVSQRAALGAALAAAAGWGHGAALLASVSDRAAASGGGGAASGGGGSGARPELLPLLSALPPPLLDARAARALFDAGITDVAKVARAAEERLARAFLSRAPRQQQQQQHQIGGNSNKRPLDSAPLPSEPGAVWSRWAAKAARAAKQAAQKRVKQEERMREELAREAEAEGALLFGTQATGTTMR